VVAGEEQASGLSPLPRRAWLRGAVGGTVGLAALTLVGCGSSGKVPTQAVEGSPQPVQSDDVAILNRLLDLERQTVAAYTAGTPLLPRPEARTARQFLDEELEHTGELLSLIKAADGISVDRRPSYDLGHPRSAGDVLTLLHALERAQVSEYLAAIPRLSPGPVRAAAASILASDAQHIAILRLAQGDVPAPSAFVTGRE
jgi:Ferritin-like domain